MGFFVFYIFFFSYQSLCSTSRFFFSFLFFRDVSLHHTRNPHQKCLRFQPLFPTAQYLDQGVSWPYKASSFPLHGSPWCLYLVTAAEPPPPFLQMSFVVQVAVFLSVFLTLPSASLSCCCCCLFYVFVQCQKSRKTINVSFLLCRIFYTVIYLLSIPKPPLTVFPLSQAPCYKFRIDFVHKR